MSTTLTDSIGEIKADQKLVAAEKKKQGNEAFRLHEFNKALELYDEAIALDPTEMSFYNNKGAVYIQKRKFLLAKNVCFDALSIGEKHGGSNRDKARSLARIGKAYLLMGDIYNAMLKYDEALSTLEHDEFVKIRPVCTSQSLEIDDIRKQAAVEKKELGNTAYRNGHCDEALAFYDEAVKLNPTEITFYNNKGAVYIKNKDFLLAKNICYKALEIGEKYGASDRDRMRSHSRIGKACWELGDLYDAMYYYKNALSTYKDKELADELDKVCSEVIKALLKTDNLSKEKIAAAGDMISTIYIDRQMTYKTEYENPVMFPQAPQQTFVDAFTEADQTKKSLIFKVQQSQYAAEVDLYTALEGLASKRKIIVLHNFEFTKEQAGLYSCSSDHSAGEHDFVVILRGHAVILFEVKSPEHINEKTFKRNWSDAQKQLKRAHKLVEDICSSWGIALDQVFKIYKYTVFPRTAKADITELFAGKRILPDDNLNILFQDDVKNFARWWIKNIMSDLVEHTMSIQTESRPRELQHLEASLIGLWCIDQHNKCNIDTCSLGYCIKKIDQALKSADISQNIHNPVTKSVKVSPEIFKKYLGIDCLTDEQKNIFQEDKTCQFIMGSAGSGKTVLLFGKMIQIFLKENPGQLKKQILFVTGSMDLAPIEDLLRNVGMKSITSHRVFAGHSSIFGCLRLMPNELFIDAFNNSNPDYDIFIMHHNCLIEDSFWPVDFLQVGTEGDILTSLVSRWDYHTFIDDIHNYWDKYLVSFIESNHNLIYNCSFVKRTVDNLKTEMNKRLINGVAMPLYLWIACDMRQMAYSLHHRHKMPTDQAELLQKQTLERRLLFLYSRDLDDSLTNELEEKNIMFRPLSRNLRNSVGISGIIENVRMHYGNDLTNFQWPGENLSQYSDKYKLYKRPGHHIQGPKPHFVLIKKCEKQEEIVHRVIRDELNKLLELGDALSPKDIAIITDAFCPMRPVRIKGETFKIRTFAMMKFHEKRFNEVTIRRVTDRNSVQASEWKAVIFVRNLEEYLDCSIPKNISLAVDGDTSVLESVLTLYSSTQYIPLSRARVYLTVIGVLGGALQEVLTGQFNSALEMYKETKNLPMLKCILRTLSKMSKNFECPWSKNKKMMYSNEEYEHYKRTDFVYRVVDIDHALDDFQQSQMFKNIWFEPLVQIRPSGVLDPDTFRPDPKKFSLWENQVLGQ